jgi:hypothetical protein
MMEKSAWVACYCSSYRLTIAGSQLVATAKAPQMALKKKSPVTRTGLSIW